MIWHLENLINKIHETVACATAATLTSYITHVQKIQLFLAPVHVYDTYILQFLISYNTNQL